MSSSSACSFLLLLFSINTARGTCPSSKSKLIATNYTPLGVISNISGIAAYDIGRENASSVVIGISDIFGIQSPSTNFRQVADMLSAEGYRVILPDFFDGRPWDMGQGDPKYHTPNYVAWQQNNSFENVIRPKLRQLIGQLQSEEAGRRFALFGTSYGGFMAGQTSALAEFSDALKVIGRFAEAPDNTHNPQEVKVPTLILSIGFTKPGVYEAYCDVINANLGNGSCVHKLFAKEFELGLIGSEANWEKDTLRTDAETSLDLFKNFLCLHC